jgi:hypothetical protein
MKMYLNEKQVAEMTGLAVQTLRNWRFQRRGFNYIRVSKSIRYDLEDVIAFMEERKIRMEGRDLR